jgi:sugar lactone lactonase YvrE
VFFTALLFVCLAPLLLGDDVDDSRRFQKAAADAYQAKNYASFLENIRKASDLRPQHPTLLYQFAAALELNGKRDEAVRVLERVAAMGFVYDISKDFVNPAYAKVAKRFEANAKPIGTAKRELSVDRIGMIPEGIAWDGKRFFVSSVRTKIIFAVGAGGKAEEFATAPYGVFGMVADTKRGVLWAAIAAIPQVEGYVAEDAGKAAVLRIALATGRILETIRPPDDVHHHFGDITLAPDGEVYVSDALTASVWRVNVRETASTLEPFLRGPFSSLQGMAVSGNVLFVSDYAKGLFAIDRRTKDLSAVPLKSAGSLLGIDGLYVVDEKTLVATQNGTNPNRIIRIDLDRGTLAVKAVVPLLVNSPEMADPTLGVVANHRFYFNANGQWDLFGEEGKIADPLKLTEAVVLSVPLR